MRNSDNDAACRNAGTLYDAVRGGDARLGGNDRSECLSVRLIFKAREKAATGVCPGQRMPGVLSGQFVGARKFWEHGRPSGPDPAGGMPMLPVSPDLLRANDNSQTLITLAPSLAVPRHPGAS